MKSKIQLAALGLLMLAFGACQSQAEYCTVKGTIQGVHNGTELHLLDAWNHFKVIAATTVENGSFELCSRISAPTHAYLYTKNPKDVYTHPWDGGQLKEVYDRYHDKGLEIYSVSQDSKTKEWKSYVEENGMTWINVLAERGKVYKDYSIEYIPTMFLIDCKTGEILVRDSLPDLESILSDLLP